MSKGFEIVLINRDVAKGRFLLTPAQTRFTWIKIREQRSCARQSRVSAIQLIPVSSPPPKRHRHSSLIAADN
jgi:hypothetical protein